MALYAGQMPDAMTSPVLDRFLRYVTYDTSPYRANGEEHGTWWAVQGRITGVPSTAAVVW